MTGESATREELYGDGEPTRDDVLAAFRRRFDSRDFPGRATDAEIAAILSPPVPLDAGFCGPGSAADHVKMNANTWKFWVHWTDLNPQIRQKPVLSGRRAFVQAAREAFGIGIPAPNRGTAIETLAMPVGGEVLPPPYMNLDGLLAPLDDHELSWGEFDRICSGLAQRGWRMGITGIYVAGRALAAYRARAGYGQWGAWLEATLPISHQTAGQLMRIARDANIGRYLETVATGNTLLPDDRRVLDEICGLEAEQFDGLIEGGVIHAEMRRGDLRRHLVQSRHGGSGRVELAPIPEGKYSVILADPPWPFEAYSGGGKGRSTENHYPTMSADELALMAGQVRGAAAEDCALFLWTISSHLDAALLTMRQWGFDFRATAFVWAKEGAPGLGYWTRCRTEICLLGARGRPKRLAADVDEFIHAPRGRHSEKPEEVYGRIERLVAGPYLELFARRARSGWDGWGNDPALAEAAE